MQPFDIDTVYRNDILHVVPYVDDIYNHCFEIEHKGQVNEDYMSHQGDITYKSRQVLIDWILQVHTMLRMYTDTFFLAVNILDRYCEKNQVGKENYQLLGLTSLVIAYKYEEAGSTCAEIFNIFDKCFDRTKVIEMEMQILNSLNFYISAPTPTFFLRRFDKAAFSNRKLHLLGKEILEISLLYIECLKFPASMLAASSVFLARVTLNDTAEWTKTLVHYTRFTLESMAECIKVLLKCVHRYYDKDATKYTALLKKYSLPCYMKIAEVKFPTEEEIASLL